MSDETLAETIEQQREEIRALQEKYDELYADRAHQVEAYGLLNNQHGETVRELAKYRCMHLSLGIERDALAAKLDKAKVALLNVVLNADYLYTAKEIARRALEALKELE